MLAAHSAASSLSRAAARDDPSRIYRALNDIVKRDNDADPAVRS